MGFVDYEVKGQYAIATINRPEALNALNEDVMNDIEAMIDGINLDEIRCLILTGAGEKSFVAGADIGTMRPMKKSEGEAWGKRGNDVFRKIETLPIPVIAAVNGFALGGGCELAMACDIRIASTKAKFGQPEVGLGLIPGFGGNLRLPRLVGKGNAKYLIYSADMIDAAEAYRIGLVQKVAEPEELIAEAEKMAGKIAAQAPIAVAVAKDVVNNGYDVDMKSGSNYEVNAFSVIFDSEDMKEGTTAFLEKRKAEWKNK